MPLPVASPPECKILLMLCAASSVNVSFPSEFLSNFTPFSIKSLITSSEASEIYSTVFSSLKPAPAFNVS